MVNYVERGNNVGGVKEAEKQTRAAQPKKKTFKESLQKLSKEHPYIKKKLIANFVSPESSYSENGWDIDPEVVPEKEAPGEEFIDTVGPETPTINRTKDKQVENQYRVTTVGSLPEKQGSRDPKALTT